MYKVVNTLKDIKLVRIFDKFFSETENNQITVKESTYSFYGKEQYLQKINHETGNIVGDPFGGYENGIWKINNKDEIMILQDYGDYSYWGNTDKNFYLEIDEQLIYKHKYSRSLGFFDGYVCLLLPHENILDIIKIAKHDIPTFDSLNSKRPYSVAFLLRNTTNYIENPVIIAIEYAGKQYLISLEISYKFLIHPNRLTDIIYKSCDFYEKDECETDVEYQQRILDNDGYITVYFLLQLGFEYNAEERYFHKDGLRIYTSSSLQYFSTDEDFDTHIWYKSEVEELLNEKS